MDRTSSQPCPRCSSAAAHDALHAEAPSSIAQVARREQVVLFVQAIDDGFLALVLVRHVDSPAISALEVERVE